MCLSVKSYNPSESVIQTYKARTMNGMFEPAAVYDDIKLCNSVGVYKNSNGNNEGLFDGESDYLQNLQPAKDKLQISEGDIALYPNPANTQITIAYHLLNGEEGKLIIYEMLGRERMAIELTSSANKVIADVSNLEMGLFTYKYFVNNESRSTGKLLIEK
jgi:Secretion system C-terminal sorting domain